MKRANASISDLIARGLRAPCFEPIKRVKCLERVPRGYRDVPESPRWIRHRYEIIGGICAAETLKQGICADNPMLLRLRAKSEC